MDKLYYDPESPAGYAGEQALFREAKKVSKKKKIKLKEVRNWLKKQKTYTLHKPIRRKFSRRQTIVAGIDHQWQADLADLSHLSKYNNKYRYLLCVIDVFSKYAWVVPIKNKTGHTLIQAFKSVLKTGRHPKSLQTDKGTEFKNKEFQHFLKSKHIHFFTTENPETKASIAERFQRTLKSRMWKYFTHHRTLKYVDVLSKLVRGYNHAFHRSIQRSPASVNSDNEVLVSETLFGKKKKTKKSRRIEPLFKVGDFVRLNKTKRTFDKGYLPNWTQELFQISNVLKHQTPHTYKIVDLDGETISGSFYSQELQPVEKEQIYEIESILDRRKRKIGKKWVKEIKVHWKGYPSKFDSWILESDLVV